MEIILIRHAERERDPSLGDDKDLPLTADGKKQTKALALRLQRAGCQPALYLVSRYAHAVETGRRLRGHLSASPPAPVIALSTLTPHEGYTVEGIIEETRENGHDLWNLNQVVIVLHHPRLNQLLAKFTGQAESPQAPEFAQAVRVVGRSLKDFVNGKASEISRL